MNIQFMQEALTLAHLAQSIDEVPVGAVIVSNGEIIGRGYNLREKSGDCTRHAEIIAIQEASKAVGGWRLIGCDMYVTLEPCPMCAGAAINSRIERVIFGASDSKAGSCGSVVNLFDLPYNHKPEIISGVLADKCGSLLTDFFRELRKRK